MKEIENVLLIGDDSIQRNEGAYVPIAGEQFHPVARAQKINGRQRNLKKLLPLLR